MRDTQVMYTKFFLPATPFDYLVLIMGLTAVSPIMEVVPLLPDMLEQLRTQNSGAPCADTNLHLCIAIGGGNHVSG